MLSIAVHTDTNHCNLDARPLAQNASLGGQAPLSSLGVAQSHRGCLPGECLGEQPAAWFAGSRRRIAVEEISGADERRLGPACRKSTTRTRTRTRMTRIRCRYRSTSSESSTAWHRHPLLASSRPRPLPLLSVLPQDDVPARRAPGALAICARQTVRAELTPALRAGGRRHGARPGRGLAHRLHRQGPNHPGNGRAHHLQPDS